DRGGGDADAAPSHRHQAPGSRAPGHGPPRGPRAAAEDEARAAQGRRPVITLEHYLGLGAVLFALSVAGIIINRKNLIVLLMCIELMLLSVNMNFVAFSRFLGDSAGQ